jgi:hypothetical protein
MEESKRHGGIPSQVDGIARHVAKHEYQVILKITEGNHQGY